MFHLSTCRFFVGWHKVMRVQHVSNNIATTLRQYVFRWFEVLFRQTIWVCLIWFRFVWIRFVICWICRWLHFIWIELIWLFFSFVSNSKHFKSQRWLATLINTDNCALMRNAHSSHGNRTLIAASKSSTHFFCYSFIFSCYSFFSIFLFCLFFSFFSIFFIIHSHLNRKFEISLVFEKEFKKIRVQWKNKIQLIKLIFFSGNFLKNVFFLAPVISENFV